MTDSLAEVVVDIAASEVDRVFHYRIPASLAGRVEVGHRVWVPFGRRRVEGTVVGLTDRTHLPPQRLREILSLCDPVPALTPALVQLARWMERRYLCPLAQALRVMLPPTARGGFSRPTLSRWVRLAMPPAEVGGRIAAIRRRAPRQAALLEQLLAAGELPQAELLRLAGAPASSLQALVEQGWVEVYQREVLDEPEGGTADGPLPSLNPDQGEVWRRLEAALRSGHPRVSVLHGVTGSGKTEIYLRAIAAVLEQGRSAICLVPEISLTPQTVARFRQRFGGQVAVLHSAMTGTQRLAAWRRIRSGSQRVVVGARSAVFAPVPQLGLIILDEEHETSYKQEEAPRYHAREVAMARAQLEGAVVLLGSATPAVETYHRAQRGDAVLLRLPRRVAGRPLPAVELVDMRREFAAGGRALFSRRLLTLLRQRLEVGQQTLLFLNRRGLHTLVLCRECGFVLRCPHCDVSLTLHRSAGGRVDGRCHYCGHRQTVPARCPACGGSALRPLGVGTQQVEEAVRRLFPTARVQRMDGDVTARRGAHESIYRRFAAGEIDVLIGTQMIAKGWDVPGVTLVGVVAADTSLHMPDFRRQERTFSLLEQVAGRAGRGDDPGVVVVQTYTPDHPCWQALRHHDYEAFFQEEIRQRRELGFPPFSHLVRAVVLGTNPRRVAAAAQGLQRAWLEELRTRRAPGARMTPAAPAPIERLRDRWRWHVLARCQELDPLLAATRAAVDRLRPRWERDLVLQLDADPVNML